MTASSTRSASSTWALMSLRTAESSGHLPASMRSWHRAVAIVNGSTSMHSRGVSIYPPGLVTRPVGHRGMNLEWVLRRFSQKAGESAKLLLTAARASEPRLGAHLMSWHVRCLFVGQPFGERYQFALGQSANRGCALCHHHLKEGFPDEVIGVHESVPESPRLFQAHGRRCVITMEEASDCLKREHQHRGMEDAAPSRLKLRFRRCGVGGFAHGPIVIDQARPVTISSGH